MPEEQKTQQTNPFEVQLEFLDQTRGELKELSETLKVLTREAADYVTTVQTDIGVVGDDDREFANQVISLVNKTHQTYVQADRIVDQLESVVEEHGQVVNEYRADPTFSRQRSLEKANPTFQDVQERAERVIRIKTAIKDLERKQASLTAELSKHRTLLGSAQDSFREAQRRQREATSTSSPIPSGMTRLQYAQVLDQEVRLAQSKRWLEQVRVKDGEMRLLFVETQLSIMREKLAAFRDDYESAKDALVVDDATVKRSEESLAQTRSQFLAELDEVQDRIRLLTVAQDALQRSVEQYVAENDIRPEEMVAIKEWSPEPVGSAAWLRAAQLVNLLLEDELLRIELDLLNAQAERIKYLIHDREVEAHVIRTWYKMSQGLLGMEGKTIEEEVKTYELPVSQADATELTERRTSAINQLHELNVYAEKLQTIAGSLLKRERRDFSVRSESFKRIQTIITQSQQTLKKQIAAAAELIEVYSKSLVIVNDTIRRIEEISSELKTRSFWQRSEQSIGWSQLESFFPDIQRFFTDLRSSFWGYVKRIQAQSIQQLVKVYIPNMWTVIGILFYLLLFILGGVVLHMYLPMFAAWITSLGAIYRSLYTITSALGVVLTFIHAHFIWLYTWGTIALAQVTGLIPFTYVSMLFYLISIPYIILFEFLFFEYLLQVNARRGYLFISQTYQERFQWVFPPLVYTTTALMFFRQAFLLAGYTTSSVPLILSALNFIILQVAIIAAIGIAKEQVMESIPHKSPLGEWVYEHIDRYYYIFFALLITTIIMCNPYVGYGRQVLYVFSRLLMTLLLIPVFSWIHDNLKKACSDFFFYYGDADSIRDRFPGGRSWYGVFVFASFIAVLILGLMVVARVWGTSVHLEDVIQWFRYELYSPGFDEVTGKRIVVTAVDFFRLIAYIGGGFIITSIVHRYILQRIFDPLLVGSGVQSTVSTLTRYIIIILAFLIGLQAVGLDSLTTKLAFLIGFLSFAIKEPVADFISYFIILVQRPVKIGDFVRIEPDISGVVRQITPRATIVRQRNSTTLIVPNSTLLIKTIFNVTYTRTFFAFDDMLITIPYKYDADIVKRSIMAVLESHPAILANPAPIVWLHNFSDLGYQFLIRGYMTTDRVLEQWEIASQIRFNIVKRLASEGVVLSYPVRIIEFADRQPKPIEELMPPSM